MMQDSSGVRAVEGFACCELDIGLGCDENGNTMTGVITFGMKGFEGPWVVREYKDEKELTALIDALIRVRAKVFYPEVPL